MNDRELLELAAKAASIDLYTHVSGGFYVADPIRKWDPLTDDGDALRLAVKLEMLFDLCGEETSAYGQEWSRENKGNNPYSATRRAIIRAAAEIGKYMP